MTSDKTRITEYSQKQADAVGKSLASTHIDVIYASPLLRAYSTAQAVHRAQPAPQPSLIPNQKLREQHFGVAEGHPWVLELRPNTTAEQAFEKGIYPVLEGRAEKFPGAESLDDLARRAEEAIEECVLPHLSEHHGSDSNDFHIAIASHGLCISELVTALLRLDPTSRRDVSYAGLLNTAWTRVNISFKVIRPKFISSFQYKLTLRKDGHVGSIDINNLPPLDVRVTDVNRADHLNGIVSIFIYRFFTLCV